MKNDNSIITTNPTVDLIGESSALNNQTGFKFFYEHGSRDRVKIHICGVNKRDQPLSSLGNIRQEDGVWALRLEDGAMRRALVSTHLTKRGAMHALVKACRAVDSLLARQLTGELKIGSLS